VFYIKDHVQQQIYTTEILYLWNFRKNIEQDSTSYDHFVRRKEFHTS